MSRVSTKKLDFFRKVQLLTAFVVLALAALTGAAPAQAHGGGTPQLVQAPSGPYEIYTWTNPEPPRSGLVHVTVALVDPATQQPVLNADVQIVATPDGESQPVAAPATHQNAVIKTYYEADLELPTAGPWQISVVHSDRGGSGSADFTLNVQPAARNWRPVAIGAVLAVIAVAAWFILRKQ
ncbi:MAG: hypothetical protein WA040_12275 [Anaerolineae bacterium]